MVWLPLVPHFPWTDVAVYTEVKLIILCKLSLSFENEQHKQCFALEMYSTVCFGISWQFWFSTPEFSSNGEREAFLPPNPTAVGDLDWAQ